MSTPAKRITLKEAADILGVSVATVRRRIDDGSLPAERIGPRLLRVYRADVETLSKPVPTGDGLQRPPSSSASPSPSSTDSRSCGGCRDE